jgi:hypothetical protein
VTETVIKTSPPQGVVFVELGEAELNGFARPVKLFEARPAPSPQKPVEQQDECSRDRAEVSNGVLVPADIDWRIQ